MKDSKILPIYRIISLAQTNSFNDSKYFRFIIQRRFKILFFSFWKRESKEDWNSIKDATIYLEKYISQKHFVKYYAPHNQTIIEADTTLELEKKAKLTAFL
jgi:hypothetical protein